MTTADSNTHAGPPSAGGPQGSPGNQIVSPAMSPPRAAWLAMLDRRDFEEWMGRLRLSHGWLAMPKNAIVRGRHLETLLRLAWEAGAASTPHTKEA